MSRQEHTVALLDRMFGSERQVGDQLDRLEMVEVDYRSIVEVLLAAARDLLDAEHGSEECESATMQMVADLAWAERTMNEQSGLLLDAVAAIDSLVGARL